VDLRKASGSYYKCVAVPVVLLETRSLQLVLWIVNLAMFARDYAMHSVDACAWKCSDFLLNTLTLAVQLEDVHFFLRS